MKIYISSLFKFPILILNPQRYISLTTKDAKSSNTCFHQLPLLKLKFVHPNSLAHFHHCSKRKGFCI